MAFRAGDRFLSAMARTSSKSPKSSDSAAHLAFEATLWLAADKLRNNRDAAEYKHVVLGLIFLKYISDSFEAHHAKLLAGRGDYAGPNAGDLDTAMRASERRCLRRSRIPLDFFGAKVQYREENSFSVPAESRWSHLQGRAKLPTIGKTVDDALVALERNNPRLKGVLPKDYARPALDKHRLDELIDLIGTISLLDPARGSGRGAAQSSEDHGQLTSAATGADRKSHRSVDLLGRVYECFLIRFASAEGRKGGHFYISSSTRSARHGRLRPHR
jgi:type I restriction enzyme M protein